VVFQGDLGTAHIEVTQVPVFVWEPGDTLTQQQQQGPPAPTLHVFTYGAGLPPGVNGVCITSKNNGDVIYVQFATLKITWKGTNAAGAPVEGGCPGPITGTSANGGANGGPVKPDGGTTYVDTNTPGNGDYPNQGPGPGANERSMIDVPNVKNSAGLKNVIQAANPGVTINEITIHMNITTYVIVVTPTGRRVVKKIKWTYTETLRAPWGPDPGNGQFGGPAQGPPPPGSQFTNGQPTVEDVNAMDPNHAAALGSFQTVPATPANYTGAPANGGY
jgi:hypothetical protein